jgi:hypothetical protein
MASYAAAGGENRPGLSLVEGLMTRAVDVHQIAIDN